MNKKLTKLLEYGFAGNSEQTRMFEHSESFKKIVLETIPKEQKELMRADGLDSTTLLQEEVYKTIVKGAQPFRCMRDIIPVINTDSYSVRIVYGEDGAYAPKVAEGTAIPIDTENLNKKDITIEKYGCRPLITNEIIEDGLWDVVAMELEWAGAKLENTLNRQVLSEILKDMSGISDRDPSGTNIAVSDITKARADVRGENYIPTHLITSPTAEGYLLTDSNLVYASYADTANYLRTGELGGTPLMGLRPYTCSVTTGDGDEAWDSAAAATPLWDSADEAYDYYGIVLDPVHAARIAMRRDFTVEKYDDPIHDLVGLSATMRFGTEVIQTKAGVRILYK